MSDRLDSEAADFAARLTALVRESIGGETEFDVVELADDRRRIGPGPFDVEKSGFGLIPLRRTVDPDDEPERVSLKIEFAVGLDDEEAMHLTVQRSTFGLWIRPDPKRSARPVVRVEYDRDARNKPAAHVHLHAESVELGWLYGTASDPLPRLDEIHFPVGGRRFRPTVEELLLFLDREHLFTNWANPSGRSVVEASLDDWEARQARATVRRHPTAAAEELTRLGFDVAPPE